MEWRSGRVGGQGDPVSSFDKLESRDFFNPSNKPPPMRRIQAFIIKRVHAAAAAELPYRVNDRVEIWSLVLFFTFSNKHIYRNLKNFFLFNLIIAPAWRIGSTLSSHSPCFF